MNLEVQELCDLDYQRLADFRFALRCFLDFSEKAAAAEGLTGRQHQALLVIRAERNGEATVGRLAERLLVKHHTAVELAHRLGAKNLLRRRKNPEDGRSVLLSLTSKSEKILERLSAAHRDELRQMGADLCAVFGG